ncbi:MAG: homoserine kinase [Alphaproteobacteria bacterium]|nr:homoserine kinase [Alphaproteobacteria bacterium]MBV9693263.1 homoserine kinase [Alphaproteobacteria bacterium]
MAVYTDVSFEDLERFLAAYAIGSALSFKGIAEGVENSNYFLKTERGVFVLTLYEKRVRAGDLPFFLGLMEHLSARRIPCPLPVRGKDGALFGTLCGRPAAVLTFLNGVSLSEPEPAHCAAAGAALAAIHDAGRDFAQTRPNALGPASWSELAKRIGSRADEIEPGLARLIAQGLDGLSFPELPSGLIHADLFADNVLFAGGEISGVIDFYFACTDAFAYDLAVLLNAWCFDAEGNFDLARGKNLFAGYGTHRALTEAETAAMPMLARGAALRFLLTRLYDLLHHDMRALVRPKDPREFARRLRFHLGVRDASEYGL